MGQGPQEMRPRCLGVALAQYSSLDESYAARVSEKAERFGMYVGVSARLPRDENSTSRFESTIRAARVAGASAARTLILSPRRYEIFRSPQSYREFARTSWKTLTSAGPNLATRCVRLAIGNHRDWRIDEMLGILERIDSSDGRHG